MNITDAQVHASIAVSDLARAREWYAEKLGWEPMLEPPGTLVYQVGDSFFTLFETEFAGTAQNTVMQWNVEDASADVARLRDRGVTFEEYDFGDFRTVDGIMEDPSGGKQAWFKDADGNIIGLGSGPAVADAGVGTLAVMIAASDLGRAKRWYADALGFEPIDELPDVLLAYRSDDTWFNVYATQFAGTAKNTVAIWRMKGIRDEVASLRGRGVAFDDYDFGDDGRTAGGILSDDEGDLNAWFRDSEGNVLALAEDRGGMPD